MDSSRKPTVQICGVATKDLITKFKGRSATKSEGKSWIREFDNQAEDLGWNDRKKCKKLRNFLDSSAGHWYDQLPKEVKKKWTELKQEFKAAYGTQTESYQRQYHKMKQYDHESLTNYLYRYNAIAKKARVEYNGRDRTEHIRGFTTSILDEELSKSLRSVRIRNMDELLEILDQIEVHQINEPRGKKKHDRPLPKQINFMELDKDAISSESEYDQDRLEAAAIFALQTKTVCEKCGKGTHAVEDCWKGKVCTICNQPGHPANFCFKACKACKKIHDHKTECQVVTQLTQIQAYLKSQGVVLPEEILNSRSN